MWHLMSIELYLLVHDFMMVIPALKNFSVHQLFIELNLNGRICDGFEND